MDRPGIHKVLEGSGEQRKMEETGCEIICGAQTTVAVKGQMVMMMLMHPHCDFDLKDSNPIFFTCYSSL